MGSASGNRNITALGLPTLEGFMRSCGLDYLRAARAVGIDPDAAHDPEARISLRALAQLLEAAARESNNDAFGAQVGELFRIGTVGALDYVIANAPTLRAALGDYVRFLGLIADGLDTSFEEGRRMGYIVTHLPVAFGPRAQLLDAASSARLVRFRQILRDPSVPVLVELQRNKPKAIDEFRRIFGPRVRFQQAENRLGIAASILDRELPAADPRLYKVIVEVARKTLAERKRTTDTMLRVISFISSSLPHGEVTIAAVANAVGLSRHGLRGLLGRTGTTFRDLLDETRKTMADHYISETSLPMTEIAFLLGFSELSAFSRAARNWFGRAPRELRKRAS